MLKKIQVSDLQIMSMGDLKVFGVATLTGEACPYYQRVLCDVNEQGKILLEQFLGVTLDRQPMNSFCSIGQHVASVMFPRSMWQEFSDFAAWQNDFTTVIITRGQRHYYREIDAELLEYYQTAGGYVVGHKPHIPGQPTHNGANVAAVTGRAGNE